MKKTFFLQAFIGHLLIITLLVLLVSIFTFALIRDHYITSLTNSLKNYNLALLPSITEYIGKNNNQALDSLIKDIGKDSGTRITVIDTSGVVLGDSENDPPTMENHKNRQEILRAMIDQTGSSIRFSRTVKKHMLYVAIPIKKNEKIIGVLRSSLYLDRINTLLNQLSYKILQVLVIIIIISIIIAFIYSSTLARPIKELSSMSKRVGRGDFEVNLLFKKNDEFKELADSFNIMVAQIKSLINELSTEKEALDTIIASIREGIIVIDKKGKIILCNQSFKKIVNSDRVKDQFYWELIRQPMLNELVKKTIAGTTEFFHAEIDITGRTYICSASLLSRVDQIVITLHDITEIVNVANIKKEFILNISHELRTPLTAIKGFVETMEEEKPNKARQYIDIIKRHTDRLINIVDDLQILSRLEEKEELEIEDVDLGKMAENVMKMFDRQAQTKNISLQTKITPDLPHVKVDPFKLEQVFINLIDNAIKYTEQGQITLSINKESDNIMIKITDTGIGIPEEHIPRIFERFYVVDKSRSRTLGGTGLGLSIVKHIVLAHNGNIHVQSTVNKGTTFIITLPKLT